MRFSNSCYETAIRVFIKPIQLRKINLKRYIVIFMIKLMDLFGRLVIFHLAMNLLLPSR